MNLLRNLHVSYEIQCNDYRNSTRGFHNQLKLHLHVLYVSFTCALKHKLLFKNEDDYNNDEKYKTSEL